jgi:serine phosphatase RsbU (regulator of sigma subunit)
VVKYFLFYASVTDGIIEVRNKNDEFFAENGLKNIVMQHKNKSSSAISNLL